MSEIILKLEFSLYIRQFCKVVFKMPSIHAGTEVNAFISSSGNAKIAFIKMISNLSIEPRLSEKDIASLSDAVLIRIGKKLLKNQNLISEYEEIKKSKVYGNFFEKLKLIYSQIVDKYKNQLKELFQKFESPALKFLKKQQRIQEQFKKVMYPISNSLKSMDSLANSLVERTNYMQNLVQNPMVEQMKRLKEKTDYFRNLSTPYKDLLDSLRGFTSVYEDSIRNMISPELVETIINMQQLSSPLKEQLEQRTIDIRPAHENLAEQFQAISDYGKNISLIFNSIDIPKTLIQKNQNFFHSFDEHKNEITDCLFQIGNETEKALEDESITDVLKKNELDNLKNDIVKYKKLFTKFNSLPRAVQAKLYIAALVSFDIVIEIMEEIVKGGTSMKASDIVRITLKIIAIFVNLQK